MRYSQKELLFIVERISKQSYELTDWEQSFFKSVKHLVENGIPLAPRQAECLSKIWDKIDLK